MAKFTDEPVWADEFDEGYLDPAKWRLAYGPQVRGGWWSLDVPRVHGGMLHIPTIYSEQGMLGGPPGYYTAGIDTSLSFRQKYGYFEARCRLPKGVGQWSAFWMFNEQIYDVDGSGHSGTEIDIYESPYYRHRLPLLKNVVTSNLHYDGYGKAHRMRNVGRFRVKDPYDSFHTYGLEWNEEEYIFYIDGVESGRSSFGGVSQNEQWLILSVEHELGGWAGDISKNKPEEMTDFVVDYVRVYQYK
jgi:beta-glucanase (GH16 family)